ncbi:hypothetical protein D7Y05_08045 [bacterium 1XD42-54]|nr:hypothetical protein D7Y05_08045 [bacterium 1XD42-54]
MIPDNIMEKIIHVPDESEYMEELQTKLAEEGFVITNFSKGGVFYAILRIVVHGMLQLKQLAVQIVNSAFMVHCPDDWVEIRAADYAKYRKEGIPTKGYVTVYRRDYSYPVKIKKGHPFITSRNAEGAYFTFYAAEDTVMPEGVSEYKVIVEAEQPGAAYNVEPGTICETLVYIDGYDHVRNEEDWVVESGTEIEEIESLRQRCLNSRAENARLNPDRKLQSIVESISGVVTADIDSQAPRGEGTVDIIVTGAEGTADEALIQKVKAAIKEMEGSYGDYLVKSAESVKQDFELTVYVEQGISVSGYEDQIRAAIMDLMDVSKRKELNTLYRDAIIGKLISTVQGYKKTDITVPAADVIAERGKVIVTGEIHITVKNIS